MDETAMKLGLLMEAAHANQKAAESSLRKLRSATASVAEIVREEVHRAAIAELQSLAADSNRASLALREVRRAANVRVLVWSVCITTVCSMIPLGLACWIIPSRAEISALRARHDELLTRIASLEQRGGRIDLRRCGSGARLCVRVDRKAPTFGEQSDYLVVRGY